MATNILIPGETYIAERFRKGEAKNNGMYWELISVSKEGKNPITIWPTNKPCGVTENGRFQIVNISAVKFGFKKTTTGNWEPNCNIDAEVKPIADEFGEDGEMFPDGGFAELDMSDDELPLFGANEEIF